MLHLNMKFLAMLALLCGVAFADNVTTVEETVEELPAVEKKEESTMAEFNVAVMYDMVPELTVTCTRYATRLHRITSLALHRAQVDIGEFPEEWDEWLENFDFLVEGDPLDFKDKCIRLAKHGIRRASKPDQEKKYMKRWWNNFNERRQLRRKRKSALLEMEQEHFEEFCTKEVESKDREFRELLEMGSEGRRQLKNEKGCDLTCRYFCTLTSQRRWCDCCSCCGSKKRRRNLVKKNPHLRTVNLSSDADLEALTKEVADNVLSLLSIWEDHMKCLVDPYVITVLMSKTDDPENMVQGVAIGVKDEDEDEDEDEEEEEDED